MRGRSVFLGTDAKSNGAKASASTSWRIERWFWSTYVVSRNSNRNSMNTAG